MSHTTFVAKFHLTSLRKNKLLLALDFIEEIFGFDAIEFPQSTTS